MIGHHHKYFSILKNMSRTITNVFTNILYIQSFSLKFYYSIIQPPLNYIFRSATVCVNKKKVNVAISKTKRIVVFLLVYIYVYVLSILKANTNYTHSKVKCLYSFQKNTPQEM